LKTRQDEQDLQDSAQDKIILTILQSCLESGCGMGSATGPVAVFGGTPKTRVTN
jgi:hypothetical protein